MSTSLQTILEQLIKEGVIKKGSDLSNLTSQEWEIIDKRMRDGQEQSFKAGNRLGIKEGLTPQQQAEKDRSDLGLRDPLRDQGNSLSSSEGKG